LTDEEYYEEAYRLVSLNGDMPPVEYFEAKETELEEIFESVIYSRQTA
jgi:hypothetical protein